MSTFKDFIARDIDEVFFNQSEFADWHDINGDRICCHIDLDLTDQAENQFEGVYRNSVTLYLKAGSLVRRPVENEPMYIDERLYFVRRVSDEMGAWVIVLEANEQ